MNQKEKIKKTIDGIRPYINLDGGDIEFIDIKENIVYIKLSGNCTNCLMQDETLNSGLLKIIQEECPEITSIININL